MLSTPPAMARSICPAMIARAAVPTASAPLAQSRLIVVPGTLRAARPAGRHAGNVAVILAGLIGAAEKHVVDHGRIDIRVARQQGRDRDRRQIIRAHARRARP